MADEKKQTIRLKCLNRLIFGLVMAFLGLVIWFWQSQWLPIALAALGLVIIMLVAARLFLAAYYLGQRSIADQRSDPRPRYMREIEYVAASAWATWRKDRAKNSGNEPAP